MPSSFPLLDTLLDEWLRLANSALPDAPVRKRVEPRTRGRASRTLRSRVGR
jgi:ribosomal protein L22